MLSSKIKIGDKVAVFVQHIDGPREFTLYSKTVKVEHGTVSSKRGVPKDVIGTWYEDRYVVEATVVAKGVDRYVEQFGWSRYYDVKQDGIMVEFATPVVEGSSKKQEVKTAVLAPKRVLMPWAELAASKQARIDMAVARNARHAEKAVTFADTLEQFEGQLTAIGLRPSCYDDMSGIFGRGYSMSTDKAVVDGETTLVGWGNARMTTVDRRLFEQLVAIAAKHGEEVDLG